MHHEAQRLGASTTSSSPLRCMSQRVAFRPLVSRVVSVTSSNSKLNRDALASTSREVMSLVLDRKSTRLNSSHVAISYAVFCLKKKKRRSSLRLRVQLLSIYSYK